MKHIRYGYAAGRPIQSIVNGPRPIVMVVHANGHMWFFRDGTPLDDDGNPIAETTYELVQLRTDDGLFGFGSMVRHISTNPRFELLADGEVVATGEKCYKIPGRKRQIMHYVIPD